MGIWRRLFGKSENNVPLPINADKIGQVNIGARSVTQHLHLVSERGQILPNSIPKPKGFVGRRDELDQLIQKHKEGQRTFVICGLGGIGKTDLARTFAKEISPQYDASIEVQMRGTTSPLSALDATSIVAFAFNPSTRGALHEQEIRNAYITSLAKYRTILLLDDARDLDHIGALTEGDCCLIVTSRNRIYLHREPFDIHSMNDIDASALLLAGTRDRRIAESSSEIIKLCGHLPLAIKVIRDHLASHILIRLPDFLDAFRAEKLNHLDQIVASLELSCRSLDNDLYDFWKCLSAFPGSFEASAASIYTNGDGTAAALFLEKLVDLSLVEVSDFSAAETLLKSKKFDFHLFRLHDLARDFARSKLSEDQRRRAEFVHSQHYGILLANTEVSLERKLVFFDLERHNIEAGFDCSAELMAGSSEYANLCLLYTANADALSLRLLPRTLLGWLDTAIAAARLLGNTEAEANRLANRGLPLYVLGQYDDAIESFQASLDLASNTDDQVGIAKSLCNLAASLDFKEEYEKSLAANDRALAIAIKINSEPLEAAIRTNISQPLIRLARHSEAVVHLDRAIELCRSFQDRVGEGIALSSLATAYDGLGQLLNARGVLFEALEISRDYGDRRGEGIRLGNIGNTFYRTGEVGQARDYWNAAVTILDSIESPQAETYRDLLKTTAG